LAYGDADAGNRKVEGDFSVVAYGQNDVLRNQAVDLAYGRGAKVERYASNDAVIDASFTTGTGQAAFTRDQLPGFYSGQKSNYYSTAQRDPGEHRTPIPRLTEASASDLAPKYQFKA